MLRGILKLLLLLLLTGIVLFPSPAMALGLGIAPGKLDFTVRAGGTEVKMLNVINQSDQTSEFHLYVEGKNDEWFAINPGEFILPPGQSKAVEVTVAPPLTASDEHELTICVVSLPPGSELRIGAGVKVPAHIRILEFPLALIAGAGAAFVLLVLLIGTILWRRRRDAG
ncbi:hypothetical protein ACFLYF_01595 [Chloroflexota bacterium]